MNQAPMKVSMTEFKRHFDQTLDLAQTHGAVEITVKGITKYVLVSITDYEKLKFEKQRAEAAARAIARRSGDSALSYDPSLAATLATSFYGKRSKLKISLDENLNAELSARAKALGVPLKRYIECVLIAAWVLDHHPHVVKQTRSLS